MVETWETSGRHIQILLCWTSTKHNKLQNHEFLNKMLILSYIEVIILSIEH